MTDRDRPFPGRAERRIEAALQTLGKGRKPSPGWEARVLAVANATEPRRPWWSIALPAFAAALAVGVVVVGVAPWRGDPPAEKVPLYLAMEVESRPAAIRAAAQPEVMRGHLAMIGDIVLAEAVHGGPHRAIWIFRGNERVLACPGSAGCIQFASALKAVYALPLRGRYTIVGLSSDQPIGALEGTRDEVLAAAKQRGMTVKERSLFVN